MKNHYFCKLPDLPAILYITALGLLLWAGISHSIELPEGYWGLQESESILEKTLVVNLSPDISILSPSEKAAALKLLEVGEVFQNLYERSLHHQARSSLESLEALHESLGSPIETKNLLQLYYLFRGPIARTLENTYVPFLPVDAKVPGKNVYPWGISKKEIEKFLASHPEERPSILHLRRVVRRAEQDGILADLAVLDRYPVLDALHPGLRERLENVGKAKDESALYSIPYSVAYANTIMKAYGLLCEASSIVEKDDVEFSRFLAHRARDLLVDDYEAGDASWVTGRFRHLNAQIGSYEVYDDELYAAKSFFGLSLLVRDEEKSTSLRPAIKDIQYYEESLPYQGHKKVREDIPVGVYNIIADFGQARGANTATILPNESYITRKYGRTILLRNNILTDPGVSSIARDAWRAAVSEKYYGDFQPDGNFYRTLWHEIGHYLGPNVDKKGRSLSNALEEYSQVLEELKADLVTLFLGEVLRERGYYNDEQLRSVYASGIHRVLLKNRPRREQTYQTMELMQMNFFLENGLLTFDGKEGKLGIDYSKYHQVVAAMLKEVLFLQQRGDKAEAERFIERYGGWGGVHTVVASNLRRNERYRYVIVRYGALGD